MLEPEAEFVQTTNQLNVNMSNLLCRFGINRQTPSGLAPTNGKNSMESLKIRRVTKTAQLWLPSPASSRFCRWIAGATKAELGWHQDSSHWMIERAITWFSGKYAHLTTFWVKINRPYLYFQQTENDCNI